MRPPVLPPTVAVIGTGLAGTACALGLHDAGVAVTLFDKSRGVGGRLASRAVRLPAEADRPARELVFDHGAPWLAAHHGRLRSVLARAEAAGVVRPWQPRVHAAWPAGRGPQVHVPVPAMPALVQYLLGALPVKLSQPVQRLQRRRAGGWDLIVEGRKVHSADHVVLAMPPAQAAVLLAGHLDPWADTLAAWPMAPAWTLMGVTDDVDWPWDAAMPARGPLAWLARQDRRPGRVAQLGQADWVAHATPAWSAEHLDEDPADVAETLSRALQAQLPVTAGPVRWYHRAVHRWRYAMPAAEAPDARLCWWEPSLGLGVCGDFLGGGDADGAWRSGDELGDRMAAELEGLVDQAH